MKTKTNVMKTTAIAVLASLGLAGCVAVPLYDAPYGYAPPVAYGPPAIVVRPYVGYGYYGGYRGYGGPRHHW